jgi:tRNA pseudouridine55 synthase
MRGPRGFVVIDKPPGLTSHDVVARVRRVFGIRRVGHGGTLDPMATGVLVVGISDATRLLKWVSEGDKCYEATLRLGSSTLTDDSEGEVVAVATSEALSQVTEPAIGRVIQSLHGSIMQVPSTVSAIKREGVRAYARVRAGESFELDPRSVVITSIEWRVLRRAVDFLDLYLSVCCSSGTYVRALARDIGRELGVGGHLTSLRRTRVGGFSLDDAVPLAKLTDETLIPLAISAQRILPVVTVSQVDDAHVRHGRPIPWPTNMSGTVALLDADGSLLAVCHDAQGVTRYDCVFA